MLRAAFYIDGFNLYHALHDLRKPHLKWLNLWRVAEHLIEKQYENVSKVVWCSAEPTHDVEKLKRHQEYQEALKSVGVQIVLGHFIHVDTECVNCPHVYSKPLEKQGDINVALHAYADAVSNAYDSCYIVSADSDQVATLKFIRGLPSAKDITLVAPPGRVHSKAALKLAHGDRTISETVLQNSLFGLTVPRPGKSQILRPSSYAPPAAVVTGPTGKAVAVSSKSPKRPASSKPTDR